MKDYKKFAAKNFKSKRLKKKQITKLRNEYERLCKKHYITGPMSFLVTKPVPEKELIIYAIGIIYSTNELMTKNKKGEIFKMDPDTGEMYLPKEKPGFVPK